MRLFIAIHLSVTVLDELTSNQGHFKTYGQMRCPAREQLHLTLKFLGECNPEPITTALSAITFQPFTLTLSHIGTFNDRILWAAFKDNPALTKLKKDINTALPAYRDDKPFKPHVTLARIQTLTDTQEFRKTLQMKIPFLTMQVSQFSLMQSTLLPTGPVYAEIGRYSAVRSK
ncbi:MAG: RNA 2',3'-cyclic phosphodiesterase [Nanoarchaeota archaeon]